MGILLALLSALAWGVADFSAGLGSRGLGAPRVTVATQTLGLITAGVAVLLFPGVGPRASALEWGALSGVGSAVGTLSLYHGLAVGRMTVVATLSGVLAAVVPVIVGLALGNTLGLAATLGIAIAIPAILLVSWRPEPHGDLGGAAGVPYGLLSGLGFGLLFVALDRAGTRSGAWPLIPGQLISVLLIIPFAARGLRDRATAARGPVLLTLTAGILSGTANLLFLAATGHGELAIVAVLSALYPAITVLLARAVLSERWSASQTVGLVAAVLAVILVSVG
ncbi:MAG TPA: DMT family transporter [Solirubrobacteraceae bacterium]|nr:DMT family transporter [Solirubrobacteraceae bacterium]